MRSNKEMATVALDFLRRANIVGGEVPAYVEVHNWLTSISDGALDAVAEPEKPVDIKLGRRVTNHD